MVISDGGASGGDAEDEGVFVEVAERVEVAVRERVMRFVHDHEAEVIAWPAFAPRAAHERLHTREWRRDQVAVGESLERLPGPTASAQYALFSTSPDSDSHAASSSLRMVC